MPEIKNTFTQGKMNKDLDERIIPNGQYRHAMNVQVSTSEGADVGTVQNILGNTSYANAVGSGGTFKCVGSVADEKTNKLYWFVTSDHIDAILECSDLNKVNPIIIDLKAKTANAVLKFTDNIITSINIVDNLLLWTDNVNEPRRINIDRCRSGNPPNFVSLIDVSTKHTKLFIDGEVVRGNGINTYADMTWVKPGPGQGTNNITLFDVSRLQVGDKLDKFKTYTFLSDITISSITPNSSSHAYPEGGVVGLTGTSTGTGITPPYINPNDRLTFSRELDITEDYITAIKKKPLEGLSVKINPTDSDSKTPLFERIFPRFSYRYKYVDGEYSPFGPFTDVVFNSTYPEDHNGFLYDNKSAYNVDEPYNSGMRNMIKSIELSDFIDDTTPKDIVQIDILYKQEDSNTVYVLESIKREDKEWTAQGSNPTSSKSGNLTIKSENIYAATPTNQLLRPWDNIPRKALSQEITGNRVVYGNYLQNYTNDINPVLNLDYEVRFGHSLHYETYSYESDLLTNGGLTTAASWTLGTNIINTGYRIKFDQPNQGEQLNQDNIPPLVVGETYRITITVRDTLKNGSKLDGKLVDNEGNYIQFANIKGDDTFVFEEELQDAGGGKLNASFHNRFFIQTTGNGSSKFLGYINNIKVEKRFRSTTSKTFQDGGFPSIKSQRNYQLGIVYGDKYGRETPVFTSSDSSIVIPWESDNNYIGKTASQSLQLNAGVVSPHPEWADYYKFFIKETSGEYYNLVMDAVYAPTKDDAKEESHLWISFASSDRNKMSKDSYIILKKKADDDNQIASENKFRVLDIKNEAPDAIKYNYLTLGQVTNTGEGTTASPGILSNTDANVGLFYDPEKSIFTTNGNPFPKILHFKKATWELRGGQPLTDIHFTDGSGTSSSELQDLYLSFTRVISEGNEEKSKRYKIASIQLNANNVYIVRLAEDITEIDSDMAESDGESGFIDKNITVKIERKTTKDLEAFSGRFFVKITSTDLTKDKIESISDLVVVPNHTVTAKMHTRWLNDVHGGVGNYDPANGLINQQTFSDPVSAGTRANEVAGHSTATLTKTENDWDAVHFANGASGRSPFIDNMYVAATQLDTENSYARNSGQGWKGGIPSVPGDILHDVNENGEVLDAGGSTVIVNPLGGYTAFPSTGSGNMPDGYTLYTHSSGDKIAYPAINTMELKATGTTSDPGKYLINGLDGVITTDDNHVSKSNSNAYGIRRWRNSIHDDNMTLDNTYGAEQGKHYIHISFMGPGVDLHGGVNEFPSGGMGIYPDTNTGEVLAGNLQGIWGGGVFTKEDGTAFPGNNISGHKGQAAAVFMEGTNTSSNNTGFWGYSEGVSSPGHDWRHRAQWREDRPGGTDSLNHIKEFTDQLKTVGKRFRFSHDSSGEIYTILSSTKKLLYNHTPWRKSYHWDGNAIVSTGDSVEDAVVDWANERADTDRGQDAVVRNQTKYDNMCQRIVDFGARNNRRVCYIIEVDKDVSQQSYNPVDGVVAADAPDGATLDAHTHTKIEFIKEDFDTNSGVITQNPAIWETEPKENVDIDIYHEASPAYSISIDSQNKELVAPVGCEVKFPDNSWAKRASNYGTLNVTEPVRIKEWTSHSASGSTFTLDRNVNAGYGEDSPKSIPYAGKRIRFMRNDGSYNTGVIKSVDYTEARNISYNDDGAVSGQIDAITIQPDLDPKLGLSWYNCFSFGNGVESNRIRDDFNAMVITNGVKANTTLDKKYEEERRKSGLIYSGIFNSTSGVNNLNQFIAAEKITKDLNPTYGSIQKLFSRRISLIAFCEDRVVGITANKSALYNADGKPQIVASDAVLGDANPFVGDFGISTNPESFAKESYRAYFTDRQRGAVLRLSMDGLTPISDAGMRDYFRDNLRSAGKLIGSYDAYKKNYNLTLSEPPKVNVINNGFFDEGDDLIEYFNEQELINDGSFAAGSNRTLPQEPLNVTVNPDLDSGVTITNRPAINAGDIQIHEAAVTGGTIENYDHYNATKSIFDWDVDISYNYAPGQTTPTQGGDIFASTHTAGDTTGDNSAVGFNRSINGSVLSGTPTLPVNFPNQTSALDSSGSIAEWYWTRVSLSNGAALALNNPNIDFFSNGTYWNTWVVGQNGYTGTGATGANATPNPNRNSYAKKARVWPKLRDLSNSTINVNVASGNPGMTSKFPNATNTTTFHSEAYKVTIKVQFYANPDPGQPWRNITAQEKASDIEIKMWGEDPDNPGADWLIPDGHFTAGPHAVVATPTVNEDPGGDHDHTSVAAGSLSHQLGWIDSNTITLNNMQSGTHDIEFYMLLSGTDGVHRTWVEYPSITTVTGKTILAPITNFIEPRIGIVDDNSPVSLLIKKFKLEKIRRVKRAGNNIGSTAEIPEIPSSTDPALPTVNAWAEVQNTAVNDWSVSGNGLTTQTTLYGPDTGTGTPIYYTLANGTTNVYYTAAPNNVTDFYDNTLNAVNPVNSYIDGSYYPDGFVDVTTTGDGGDNAYLTQDVSTHFTDANGASCGFIVDNWYEAKLTGVTGSSGSLLGTWATGILVKDAFPNNYPGYTSGDTLPGHLGAIGTGTGNNHIIFSDQGGGEYIARWQQKNNTNLNELTIFFFHFTGTVDKIELFDITEKETGGNLAAWSLGPGYWIPPWTGQSEYVQLYHGRSPRRTTYHNDGKVFWGNDINDPNNSTGRRGSHVAQSFSEIGNPGVFSTTLEARGKDINSSPPVTNDGYELKFTISDYVQGELHGYVMGALDAVNSGEAIGINFDGIVNSGFYSIKFNMDGTTGEMAYYLNSDYTGTPLGVSTNLVTTRQQSNASQQWGKMNKIVFYIPGSGGDFRGKLDNVSLKDITNYFTGGSSENWVFSGFDQTVENYISWNDTNKNLVFDNAPIGVSLKQTIPQKAIEDNKFFNGANVNLEFEVTNYYGSGSISGYFYNKNGYGFTFKDVDSNGRFIRNFILGDATEAESVTTDPNIPRDTLVIEIDNEPFTAILDNFKLYRYYPDFTPTTITYSEDVKGWTSFKSFILEAGLSLSSNYYTMKDGKLWKHHSNETRNWFYGEKDTSDNPIIAESTITAVLNTEPSLIKIFNTLNYEGSQSRVYEHNADSIYPSISNISAYNLEDKEGWYVGSISTDKQEGSVREFIEKEGKWFNYIKGKNEPFTSDKSNVGKLTSQFSFQGLGIVSIVQDV